MYFERLMDLGERGVLSLPFVPPDCFHNAHMFYIKLSSLAERERLSAYLRDWVSSRHSTMCRFTVRLKGKDAVSSEVTTNVIKIKKRNIEKRGQGKNSLTNSVSEINKGFSLNISVKSTVISDRQNELLN